MFDQMTESREEHLLPIAPPSTPMSPTKSGTYWNEVQVVISCTFPAHLYNQITDMAHFEKQT